MPTKKKLYLRLFYKSLRQAITSRALRLLLDVILRHWHLV